MGPARSKCRLELEGVELERCAGEGEGVGRCPPREIGWRRTPLGNHPGCPRWGQSGRMWPGWPHPWHGADGCWVVLDLVSPLRLLLLALAV